MSLLSSPKAIAHDDPSPQASVAQACLDILCGASHMTLRHASEVKELLGGLVTGEDNQRGQADQTLGALEALASCLRAIVDDVKPGVSAG